MLTFSRLEEASVSRPDLRSSLPCGPATSWRRQCGTALMLTVLASCSDSGTSLEPVDGLLDQLECSIPEREFADGGVGIGGIPSLENPEFVPHFDPAAAYLDNTTGFSDPRVVGIVVEGEAFAIPHNILWWHEIVNLDFPSGLQIAVTYCPLTGSALVFDRSTIGGAELGVSGLLIRNNLVMIDRDTNRSLWPQMMREARCGSRDGTELPMYASTSMTWSGWQELHPSTTVIGENTNAPRDYTRYPYGSYKENQDLLFPQSDIDDRRPMKEWVLGIPAVTGDGGIAFPFLSLQQVEPGPVTVVHSPSPRGDVVVFWDQRAEGAMAFIPEVEGSPLTFRADDDRIVDEETGSVWRLDGVATAGPHAGTGMAPVAEAFPAFWFAWAAFHPDTEVWEP